MINLNNFEREIERLKCENKVLASALIESCKYLYTYGVCINRGLCRDLNGNCVKCMYSYFCDKGLGKVFVKPKSKIEK